MNIPTWLKPAIGGAIVGGIVTMILGFNQGGWYLGSTAERLAKDQSATAVIAALVPICVSQSKMDPNLTSKLGELGTIATSYERRDFVMKAGWATMPATDSPNSALASACADMLLKPAGT
jgi:hypothetical protein